MTQFSDDNHCRFSRILEKGTGYVSMGGCGYVWFPHQSPAEGMGSHLSAHAGQCGDCFKSFCPMGLWQASSLHRCKLMSNASAWLKDNNGIHSFWKHTLTLQEVHEVFKLVHKYMTAEVDINRYMAVSTPKLLINFFKCSKTPPPAPPPPPQVTAIVPSALWLHSGL